jgi:hypothetical protein
LFASSHISDVPVDYLFRMLTFIVSGRRRKKKGVELEMPTLRGSWNFALICGMVCTQCTCDIFLINMVFVLLVENGRMQEV